MINLDTFFRNQLEHWPLAQENYRAIESAQTRSIAFDNFAIKVQYNPSRIRSAAVNLDKQALAARPCPLCMANHPKEQEVIPFDESFGIAVNPYPVFEPHFTIICNTHTPQRLKGYITTMLNLAEQLTDYSILYNGAKCGASIPDHLHFQAIPKGVLPVEEEWPANKKISLRTCMVIESKDRSEIENGFSHSILKDGEPMMNLVCQYDGQWRIFLFPRKQHRPGQYYAEGDKQVLTSPGVIDMAGLFVFPREEDYNKVDKEIITDIYRQIRN